MSIKLTDNFYSDEFMCGCGCGQSIMDPVFMSIIQLVRYDFNRPMIVTKNGGYRCPPGNIKAGGAKRSSHPKGRAGDFVCNSSQERAELIRLGMKYGIWGFGIGPNFLHLDNRPRAEERIWHYYKNVLSGGR